MYCGAQLTNRLKASVRATLILRVIILKINISPVCVGEVKKTRFPYLRIKETVFINFCVIERG